MRAALVCCLCMLLGAADPAWFTAPPPVDGKVHGRGAGADQALAIQAAYGDLAMQLLASVSSERETVTVQTLGATGIDLRESSTARRRLSSRLNELPGAIIEHRENTDGVCYAAVAVERAILAKALAPRLAELDRSLAELPTRRPEVVDAAWAARLRAGLVLAEQRTIFAALLAGIGGAPPEPPAGPETLRVALGALVRLPQIAVLDPAGSPGLALGLARAADAAGIAIGGPAAPWVAELSERRGERSNARGWVTVELSASLRLRRRGAEAVLAVLEAQGQATSTRDAAEAYRQASAALALEFGGVASRRLPGIFALLPAPPEESP